MDELATEQGLTVQLPAELKSSKSLVTQELTSQVIHPDINTYIQAATSDNTRRAYRQDIRHFVTWGGKLPTTTDAIVKYLHTHAVMLNARTLARRLIALKNWHVLQGFSDPTSHPLIKKTLTGIKHVHGRPKAKAPALTIEELLKMVNFLKSQDTLMAWRNNALLQVGFFGAFRRSELVNIKWEHITFVSEGMEIMIPRSKTDQSGEGQVCAIPYGDERLCPVTALKIWCEKAGIQSGFVFRAIDRHDHISVSPLSMQSVNLIIKLVAKACQLPNADQFSSHSLRRGFATAASRKGAPFVGIMRHGRWRHDGTVLGYIEEGQRFAENVAKIILTSEQSSS